MGTDKVAYISLWTAVHVVTKRTVRMYNGNYYMYDRTSILFHKQSILH